MASPTVLPVPSGNLQICFQRYTKEQLLEKQALCGIPSDPTAKVTQIKATLAMYELDKLAQVEEIDLTTKKEIVGLMDMTLDTMKATAAFRQVNITGLAQKHEIAKAIILFLLDSQGDLSRSSQLASHHLDNSQQSAHSRSLNRTECKSTFDPLVLDSPALIARKASSNTNDHIRHSRMESSVHIEDPPLPGSRVSNTEAAIQNINSGQTADRMVLDSSSEHNYKPKSASDRALSERNSPSMMSLVCSDTASLHSNRSCIENTTQNNSRPPGHIYTTPFSASPVPDDPCDKGTYTPEKATVGRDTAEENLNSSGFTSDIPDIDNPKMTHFLDTVKTMLDDLLHTERETHTGSFRESHRKTIQILNNSLAEAEVRKNKSWEALKHVQKEWYFANKAYTELIKSKEQVLDAILKG